MRGGWAGGWCWVGSIRESEPVSTVTLPFILLESRAEQRGREGEREGEKHPCGRTMDQLPLKCAPTRD